MDRDAWIRQYRNHAGTWQALVLVYTLILAAMVLSGMAIV